MAAVTRQRPESSGMLMKREDSDTQSTSTASGDSTPRNGPTRINGSSTESAPSTNFAGARYSLLDFPPGLSPSPLPTIEQTPNRFLHKSAKLDLEPNPFEFSFSAQQRTGSSQPSHTTGFASSPNPILPPLAPTPRALDSFTFKTGLTPGPGGLGMLTPLSATLASLGLPISNSSTNVNFPDGHTMVGPSGPHPPEDPHQPLASHTYRMMPENVAPPLSAQYGFPGVGGPPSSLGILQPHAPAAVPGNASTLMPQYAALNGLPDQTVNPTMYGTHSQRHPYVNGLATGMDPMTSLPVSYPPHSPQAAAVALLDMRRDRDNQSRESVDRSKNSWSGQEIAAASSGQNTPNASSGKKKRRSDDTEQTKSPRTASTPPKSRRKRTASAKNADAEPRKSQEKQSESGGEDENEDGMDTEEKRKTFLERNRQAALKCRQKKKQWLQSLQQKVDYLTSDNESLQGQATQLREEILNLKTLLLAHRDCPVAKQNGLNLTAIESILPITGIQSYSHRMY
ncbi:hypothetical protein DFJ77DRAFT_470506 [Powellomyces hirtus]|nr:hypothetical protein DFJ77DRAFT_470506 [Powellomyces hirtus]